MYQYRHILVRMRMGDSNRAIADSGVAGRNKVKAIKRIALEHGWLELDKDLPDDTQLAAIFGEKPPNPTTTSSVAPYALSSADLAQDMGQLKSHSLQHIHHKLAEPEDRDSRPW